jgi:hypothetical protein
LRSRVACSSVLTRGELQIDAGEEVGRFAQHEQDETRGYHDPTAYKAMPRAQSEPRLDTAQGDVQRRDIRSEAFVGQYCAMGDGGDGQPDQNENCPQQDHDLYGLFQWDPAPPSVVLRADLHVEESLQLEL